MTYDVENIKGRYPYAAEGNAQQYYNEAGAYSYNDSFSHVLIILIRIDGLSHFV